MRDTFAEPDPATILRQVFVARVARNPSYSLRAFARNLGVSHAYLSMVLRGKRPIPARRAMQISRVVGFTESETQAFVASCRQAQMSRLDEMVSLPPLGKREAPIDFFALELDHFRVLSDWYHLAICDLTLLSDFEAEPRWIARRLGITVEEVKAALARLQRVGMLIVADNEWRKSHLKVEVPTTRPNEAIRHFHRQMIQKALDSLSSDKPRDFEARDVTGTIMPLNPARLPAVKKKIKEFRRSLLSFASRGRCTELYQLNVQLFPLTKPRGSSA